MPDSTQQASYSTEELEYRFQERRAERLRAKLLFHCYAVDSDEDENIDELDDAYGDYYAEDEA